MHLGRIILYVFYVNQDITFLVADLILMVCVKSFFFSSSAVTSSPILAICNNCKMVKLAMLKHHWSRRGSVT